MKHTNPVCIFKIKPFLFVRQFLQDFKWLDAIPRCECFTFAWLDQNTDYTNFQLSESTFQHYLKHSDSWYHYKSTSYKYNLISRGTSVFRDPYVKSALKEYDLPYYYGLCDKNKTPKPGRMYFSLLPYIYPLHKPPSHKEKYFWRCFEKAMDFVFSNLKPSKPLTPFEAFHVMPKNTSSGFNYLKHGYKTSKKKGELETEIIADYFENKRNIIKNRPVDDYCMFAMRGHLSDRLKTKTRPVWLVSGSTIMSELRFFQPFYEQINQPDSYFKSIWITGTQSLPRLRRYLLSNADHRFYNTDISSWDSFRAAWFHEKVMRRLGRLLDLDHNDRKEFNYCIDSAIRTKVLFPNGEVFVKKAGIISGTAGTLLFNSLLNTIASMTILQMMKQWTPDPFDDFVSKITDLNWLGDDFAFKTPFHFPLDQFSSMMFKYFCVRTNTSKTVIADNLDDRKYLGYQLKDGLLYRDEKELFQSLLYCERAFPERGDPIGISFSRFFSYLLLGGINNDKFVEFFYFYIGYHEDKLELANFFSTNLDNVFKLLKDVWNINIPSFKLSTLKSISFYGIKFCLLYGWDFKFHDIMF